VDFGAIDPVSRLTLATRRSQMFAGATRVRPVLFVPSDKTKKERGNLREFAESVS
jgi:hypothetical protein